MRLASIALAVTALVAIGTVESSISVEQLSQLPGRGRPPLGLGGIGLTAASILASAIVFVLLGVFLARMRQDEGEAVRSGMLAGVFAGLMGGSIRAFLVRDYLDDVVERFGLPFEFVSWSLVVFVALSVVVSAVSGAAITWLGFRGARRRPSPRPQS
ncbi:MAG TPA: hypothetical protein VFA31_00390 [Candidatus Polarisedimenticolia bacterium]|nr:hypothetical protein [Candidatus Polarisedimenticolia bacterium]